MGSFLLTLKGKITAAVLSIIVIVGSMFGISRLQVKSIEEQNLSEIYDFLGEGNYTPDQVDTILYNFAHSGEEELVALAEKWYAEMDEAVAQASIDALFTPTTIIGTIAVALVCVIIIYVLYRRAKKKNILEIEQTIVE